LQQGIKRGLRRESDIFNRRIYLKEKKHIIYKITPGSIAEEMELAPGDELVSINGTKIEDVFDYHYLVNDENLVVVVRKPDGEEWELDIEKDYDEDLGIEFENGLMDDYKSCSNKCMFCFIDQMPPGMRDTLYFKDDDSRLSFLQGNYVTLTNMKDKDIERIIRYRLDPINISVHTTNPKLRCEMLHNRFAGDALKKIDTLFEAGIEMNGQIVCCKGINDGDELDRTIRDLTKYIPHMQSLSVVPVGLTKYREGLYPLEPFDRDNSREVIALIEKWQKYCMEQFGIHFVHASDEWYLTAGLPLPEEERYDGYIQLENGVGMLRLLFTEFHEAFAEYRKKPSAMQKRSHITLATGRLAAPFIQQLADEFMQAFPERHIDVAAVRNDFFGELITVSGLVTAQDLVAQLKGRDLGEYLCIPVNMLKSGEEIFLDDWTVAEVEKALQVPVVIVKSSGQNLLDAMTGNIE
jgi:putative radical SAM enzyme (TIGR03279 family)